MIKEFVSRFEANKRALSDGMTAQFDSYKDLVKAVVEKLEDPENQYESMDPERIHQIDDGNYQGTLIFVIAQKDYQPRDYWYVKVGYGSCSGCDTLQSISEYSSEPPTDNQKEQYLTLMLHVVQGLKKMGDE